MSKNMTRKGLALGSASALIVSGFAGLPANALGLADTSFVSLTPTTGTEYTTLAAVDRTFALSANEAATVSTGNLKFLVTDPNSLVEPTIATEGEVAAVADNAVVAITAGAAPIKDKVTITDATLAGKLSTGALIYFTAALNGDDGTDPGANDDVLASKDIIFEVTVSGNDVTFETDQEIGAGAGTVDAIDGAGALQIIRDARTATGAYAGTYVIDSGKSDATNVEDIVLRTTVATTTAVTVQAWMDANGNNLIDSTEYASPARTVTWIKPSEVVATTVMAPVVGDAALVAQISTTPVLNGEQVLAADVDAINAAFTRSLVDDIIYGKNEEANSQTSVWSDVTKTFTVTVDLDADVSNEAQTVDGTGVADAWGALAGPTDRATTAIKSIAVSATKVATITTQAAHNLTSGDKVTVVIDAAEDNVIDPAAETARTVTVTGTDTFTYTLTETGDVTAGSQLNADTNFSGTTKYTVETYSATSQGLVDRVGAETYTAQATIVGVLSGNKVTTGVARAAAAGIEVSTAATSSTQGVSFTSEDTNKSAVLAGTLSVPVTIQVTDADEDPVGAGRAVKLDISSVGTANTVRINGKVATDTVLTDANGQVTGVVTVSTGVAGVKVTLKATAENIAVADIDLEWEAAAFGLVDLNGTAGTITAGSTTDRDIVELTSYTMNLMVADQWFNVPTAGTYRLNVTGEGVAPRYVALVDGRASLTATDTGVYGASMDTVVKLEKLAADGVTVASTGTYNFNANLSKGYKVNVGASGTTLYGNAVVASVAVAKKALVEIDKRTESTATPAYANNLVLNGSVIDKNTSAGKVGAVVTVSGPASILFEDGNVAKRGSLTFHAGTDGKFEIKAYSTTAQKDSVVTFTTSDGATGTIKVSFTGTGVGEGTSLTITAPAAVKPASTFQVKAKLADVYGNGVDTAAGRVKVTYTGPGIIFGTLPTETDANGELSFSVLLGSNDTGNVVVLVQYDQNGDADYVDAKDLSATSTTAITASGTVASSDQKVNAGSFKGYVALYAKGYAGQRMSAKVGNDWVVVPVLASNFERVVEFTGAGYTVAVRIYIDRVLIDTITVTTK